MVDFSRTAPLYLNNEHMRILAIETSCDETGVALVGASGGLQSPRFKILKNLVASQIKIHRPFGGVVPNLAKREHIRNLPILFKKLAVDFSKSKFKSQKSKIQLESKKPLPTTYNILPNIDLIAVTVGPGLEPALWTGINFAKEIYRNLKPNTYNLKPKLIGANHLEGHLYSFLLPQKTKNLESRIKNLEKVFPAVALIVSGGHTILLLMKSLTKWKKLGETRDDAAGEAFDKVARMLQLPYPGGPEIEKLSYRGSTSIDFPRPMMHDKSFNFSFSGLKTSVLYYLRDNLSSTNNELSTNIRIRKFAKDSLFADVSASFQQAVIDVLVHKTIRAAKEYKARAVMLSGGVAANRLLRKTLKAKCDMSHLTFCVPQIKYNLDNAVMIAVAGYMAHLRKKNYKLAAQGNLSI